MSIPADKVLERAKSSGFDAELAVAAAFRERGWGASSNVYYIDADENISRELDILAHKPFRDLSEVPETYCWIYICAEVKRTSDPFIFFSDKTQYTDFGTGYGMLHTKQNVNRFVLSYDDINNNCPVSNKNRMARSYIAFKDGKSQQVRSGIISAFKGALFQSQKKSTGYSDLSHDMNFFIPILVVDGPLWETYYSEESGELVSEEIEEITYLQNYLSPAYESVITRVAVVTLKHLPNFLKKMEFWGDSINRSLVAGRGKFYSNV